MAEEHEELLSIEAILDSLAWHWQRYLERQERFKDWDFDGYMTYIQESDANELLCRSAYEHVKRMKEG